MAVTRIARGTQGALIGAATGLVLALLPGAAAATPSTLARVSDGSVVALRDASSTRASQAAPRVRLWSIGEYLKVNVDPNLPAYQSWTFTLKRQTGSSPSSSWVTVDTYHTHGPSETWAKVRRTGFRYRVVVPAQHGYAATAVDINHDSELKAPRILLGERSTITLGLPGQKGRGVVHLALRTDKTVKRALVRRGDKVLGRISSRGGRYYWDGVVPGHWRSLQVRAWDESGRATAWTTVRLSVAPSPTMRWRQIDTWYPDRAALGEVACGVSTLGAAYCWGDNSWGQLGGTVKARTSAPQPVRGLSSGVVSVEVSDFRACAIKADGSVWCWGRDQFWTGAERQYGADFPPVRATAPVRVTGLPAVSSISIERDHACVVTTAGATWCWGDNSDSGNLGVGSTADWVAPTQVVGLGAGSTRTVDLTYRACALTTARAVLCWGRDGEKVVTTPTPVPGLPSTAVSLRDYCAVMTDGSLWCWNSGSYYATRLTLPFRVAEYDNGYVRTVAGELRYILGFYYIGETETVPVLGLGSEVASFSGGDGPCAISQAGVGYCWGELIDGRGPTTWVDLLTEPYRWSDSPLQVPNPA